MMLKRLEVSGFKSFAKPVTLEFPAAISAIVGPNGSGKSNVADAIRWVLGEQSMKSLRGKKGEDLIFGGTTQVARLGKALVSLVFDNTKKTFPYEFDEVVISRRVYRDGVNEYLLNDSAVRLRDIVELLSKVGLGASQHHIIGQGDADRILYASPRERKAMVEESLGLKIFELKKNEAERKLVQTEENIKNVESLRRELKPHLKYLEEQAKKSQNVHELRVDLQKLSEEYVLRERFSLEREYQGLRDRRAPFEEQVRALDRVLGEDDSSFGKDTEGKVFFSELRALDEAHQVLQQKRRELEHERGRLEATSQARTGGTSFSISHIRGILEDIVKDLEYVNQVHTLSEAREVVMALLEDIRETMEGLSDTSSREAPSPSGNGNGTAAMKQTIAKLDHEEQEIVKKRQTLQKDYEARTHSLAAMRSNYKARADELARAKEALHALTFEEEKLTLRTKELETDFGEFLKKSIAAHSSVSLWGSGERDALRKKVERLRIRIEEAGGVDEGVLKEFEETKTRDEFLAHELEDLSKAKEQVAGMVGELMEKLSDDFEKGTKAINMLFGKFFHEIFGGGKAEIKLFVPKRKKPTSEDVETNTEELWDGADEEEESGLDIIVDIPRKRIKSLAMLSGGERALTSIALLFALSTVNPPPFLVLDETDAALDEANSQRYGEMLRELSKKTQLIVITHNRATMKSASVLYGVTMGGEGISKLLSIQLEEAEDVLTKKQK